jgi:CheY-like chemotaxis protein
MLRELLAQEGFHADMVTRPHDALRALDSQEYDLVISDYKMPMMDGADFMEKARARLPNLPIIMVSGLMNTPELVKVANMDVTLVLEKPLDIKAFIGHVRRFVEPMTAEERTTAVAGVEKSPSETWVRTYPQLNHLSDATESSRQFAQHLWDSSRAHSYLFVGVPPGGEIELVTCELSDWFGFAGLPIHQFSINQIETLEVLQTIRELPGQEEVSKLVAITDFGEATAAEVELVQKLMAADPNLLPEGHEVCWVFYLDITRYPQSLPETGPEIFDLVKKRLVVLQPLRDRLSDLATYLKLHLERFAQQEDQVERALLSPGAVALLLGHSWPGNYNELVEAARRIIATPHLAPLSRDDAAEILGLDAAAVPVGLDTYLRARQGEFITDAATRAGVEVPAMLKNLKADPAVIKAFKNLEDLPLLYPELVPE